MGVKLTANFINGQIISLLEEVDNPPVIRFFLSKENIEIAFEKDKCSKPYYKDDSTDVELVKPPILIVNCENRYILCADQHGRIFWTTDMHLVLFQRAVENQNKILLAFSQVV